MFTLPQSWNNAINQYLPSEAGRQIFALQHATHTLTPLAGGLVLAGYCAAAIVIAAVLLVRRDVSQRARFHWRGCFVGGVLAVPAPAAARFSRRGTTGSEMTLLLHLGGMKPWRALS